jgi:hypothetical protein
MPCDERRETCEIISGCGLLFELTSQPDEDETELPTAADDADAAADDDDDAADDDDGDCKVCTEADELC